MPIEDAADRAIFTDPADFGSVVSYTKTGGAAKDVAAIFDAGSEMLGLGDLEVSSLAPRILVDPANLPAGAGDGDAVMVSGVAYVVRSIRPDGTGMAVVTLEKP